MQATQINLCILNTVGYTLNAIHSYNCQGYACKQDEQRTRCICETNFACDKIQ